jgi:hypothetical protein
MPRVKPVQMYLLVFCNHCFVITVLKLSYHYYYVFDLYDHCYILCVEHFTSEVQPTKNFDQQSFTRTTERDFDLFICV